MSLGVVLYPLGLFLVYTWRECNPNRGGETLHPQQIQHYAFADDAYAYI